MHSTSVYVTFSDCLKMPASSKYFFFESPQYFQKDVAEKMFPIILGGCLWSLSNWLCLPISISGDLFHLGFDHGIHQHLEHPSFGRICLVLLSPQKSLRPGTGPTLTPSIISCSVSQLTLRGSVGFRSHWIFLDGGFKYVHPYLGQMTQFD